jgi:hypothetical protein
MSADPSTYVVTVQGHLDEHWAEWLDDASVTHEPDGTTTLVVSLTDQAALHGLLARLRDLGITLVAVIAAPPEQPAPQQPDSTEQE